MDAEEIGICGATKGDIVCSLEPGHELGKEAGKHFGIAAGKLTEFEAEKAGEGYWNGYWWPDVIKAKDDPGHGCAHYRAQEWRPSKEDRIGYRCAGKDHCGGECGTYCSDKSWREWSAEGDVRAIGCRKETEDDYAWKGYTLAEIKAANALYRAKMRSHPQYSTERWYLKQGEIYSQYDSDPEKPPYRPWGGGDSFIKNAIMQGYLKKK